jgi:hypothetical protein
MLVAAFHPLRSSYGTSLLSYASLKIGVLKKDYETCMAKYRTLPKDILTTTLIAFWFISECHCSFRRRFIRFTHLPDVELLPASS